jgi:glutamine amidotransferase
VTEVVVVRTGTANLASVVAGLARAGATPRVAEDRRSIASAALVVLPGVGAFGAAMHRLAAYGLVRPLVERIRHGRPTLAICLGLQLLAEASDESPGVGGLAVVPGRACRFGGDVRVPQLGWNRVEPAAGSRFLEPGFAYFANSFCLRELPAGWAGGYSVHDRRFVAAIERAAVLACQFHPELSGAWGTALLRRWLAAGGEAGGPGGC